MIRHRGNFEVVLCDLTSAVIKIKKEKIYTNNFVVYGTNL